MLKIKNLLCVFFALMICTIGVTGCMSTGNSEKDYMISYMEEKYDDKFKYIDSFGGAPGSSTKILLSSKKVPDKDVTVALFISENGEESFTDNYTHLRFEDDVNTYFNEIISSALSSDVIVSYGVSTLGVENDFTSETTFDEFLKSPQASLILGVVVSDEYALEGEEEQTANKIKQALEAKKVCCYLDIYFASDKEHFKSRSSLTSLELDELHLLNVTTNTAGQVTKCEWVR